MYKALDVKVSKLGNNTNALSKEVFKQTMANLYSKMLLNKMSYCHKYLDRAQGH